MGSANALVVSLGAYVIGMVLLLISFSIPSLSLSSDVPMLDSMIKPYRVGFLVGASLLFILLIVGYVLVEAKSNAGGAICVVLSVLALITMLVLTFSPLIVHHYTVGLP
jgi:hypothetical protein